jgi:pimeloyl-ACP methyl ester carboxylesterase
MDRRQMMTTGLLLAGAAGAAEPALAQGGSAAAATPPANPLFPTDAQFWFETVRMFGAADYGGAQFGEVLAVSRTITPGDYDSWLAGWNTFADRISAEAAQQLARKHRVSARDGLLRASNYYRSSEFFLHAHPDDPRIARAYKRSVECYQKAAALFDTPIEPVEIPYEGTTLPGYFHSVDGSRRARPTLILHTGFDGSAEEMHFDGARAAVERSYNVLVFDGPGQYGPLHRARLTFRPDWEKVITPVVDFALARPDVDPHRLVLMGVSMGGELAPRAAAFEKRLTALIANDGLYDYAAPSLAAAPPGQRDAFIQAIKAEQAPQIDGMLQQIMANNPTARWAFTHGMYAFGAATPRAYMAKTLDYNLKDGIAEKITCPTLVTDAQNDLFFKGQPQQLFDHLTCKKTLLHFTEAEGAGAHCEVGASRLAFARIYDWLDETLA